MTDMTDESEEDDLVGYGRPPSHSRFRKGRSGNPKGRPRGSRKQPPHEWLLGRMVTIREGGIEKKVTLAEAVVLKAAREGLEGDVIMARETLSMIPDTEGDDADKPEPMNILYVAPGNVNTALVPLRMGKRLDLYRDTIRLMLEPWLVQAALDRLGSKRLTREEQRIVVKATRTPRKVNWPDWWEEIP